MLIRNLFVLLGISLALISCAQNQVSLDDSGHDVRIVEYVHPDAKKQFDEVTQLKCEKGQNYATQKANIRSCENQLKNDAGAIGAQVVLVDPVLNRKIGQTLDTKKIIGNKECVNCVTITGIALRTKDGKNRSTQTGHVIPSLWERMCQVMDCFAVAETKQKTSQKETE